MKNSEEMSSSVFRVAESDRAWQRPLPSLPSPSLPSPSQPGLEKPEEKSEESERAEATAGGSGESPLKRRRDSPIKRVSVSRVERAESKSCV